MRPVLKRYLPFTPEMAAAVRAGHKICTSRTSRYGNVGDVLLSDAGSLRILRIMQLSLAHVARELYGAEGFGSPEAFIDTWKRIHPRAGWRPDQIVWVHVFEQVAS